MKALKMWTKKVYKSSMVELSYNAVTYNANKATLVEW